MNTRLVGLAFLGLCTLASAQTAQPPVQIKPAGPAHSANANIDYHALRALSPTGDAFHVKDVKLQRDAGAFTLHDGTVYLYPQVHGHVTGAVFIGTGTFHLAPPAASEQHSLAMLTKSPEMNQDFATVVFRFTDDTAEELRKASTGAAQYVSAANVDASTLATAFRKQINYNIDARILEDVEGATPGHLFLASFKTPGIVAGRNVLYIVDPQGAPTVSPEEVELATYSIDRYDVWTAFHLAGSKNSGAPVHISDQAIDLTMDKGGHLAGSAVTTFTANQDGVAAVPLHLYRKLRVSGVYGPDGQPLDFIQENEDQDPDFEVMLAQPLDKGKSISLRTDYAGKSVVERTGDGNYYLEGAARESWYPSGEENLGDYAKYSMTFHVPKGLTIVATGRRISTADEGSTTTSVWQTDVPIAVAGFNVGDFKELDGKGPGTLTVQAYANTQPPDIAKEIQQGSETMGSMNTTPALKRALSEGAVAMAIYSDYFGPLKYDHIALTQQSACTYGQSWPMLVYLPVCYFWDNTVLKQLGLLDSDPTYWTTVTPHEVAHQWWGQTVGFSSYRDQWMSEGFADFSASLFLMATNKTLKEDHEYWSVQRHRIVDKTTSGMRPIDVGPVTMGVRLSNEKAGDNVYSMLVYSKGAYILHMLEMLYFSPQEKEAPFKRALQQFVRDYTNRSATTEDFKASLEKDLPKWMDLDGNGRLDWFFNAYVYGTELPHYTITSEFGKDGDNTTVHVVLTQANVSDNFHMLIPVYMELGDGRTIRIFNVPLKGKQTLDHTFNIGKPPSPPKRLLLNYNYDILSDN